MNTDRDKFLTEAMGICTHDWYKKEGFVDGHHCKRCTAYWPVEPKHQLGVINFSTWAGFGKLWEWAIVQEWFEDFLNICDVGNFIPCQGGNTFDIQKEFINPDRFATAVYEYLKDQ